MTLCTPDTLTSNHVLSWTKPALLITARHLAHSSMVSTPVRWSCVMAESLVSVPGFGKHVPIGLLYAVAWLK